LESCTASWASIWTGIITEGYGIKVTSSFKLVADTSKARFILAGFLAWDLESFNGSHEINGLWQFFLVR
ncbi:hypothetical protein V2W45_1242743, partial [Cenococcum geophilum]